MNKVLQEMHERIAAKLRRQSLTSCSRWAMDCRIMAKPYTGTWRFDHHPWLKEMMDCDSEMWVGQKGAQLGFTEAVLNRVFFKIDIERVDCLYVLPAKTPDASDFSSARFDTALELSPHLSKLFSDVKNIGHKRAGATNLYIRGSRSKSGLKSIPVSVIILDELEEMDQENIPLAMERQSGQVEKQTIAISTPRIENKGINRFYKESTEEHFYFKCPSCSKLTELIFPECITITAESLNDPHINQTYLNCRECKAKLEHQLKPNWLSTGRWIASYANRAIRGFHVNQLYSPVVSPVDIAKSYFLAQSNPSDEQEFYNSKLGITHTVEGAKVNDVHLDACTGNYKKGKLPGGMGDCIITMGVDQGKWIHYEIRAWQLPWNLADLHIDSTCKVIDSGKVKEFEELDSIMKHWFVNACVIDAQPEKRKAVEFATRFSGHVLLCYYSSTNQGKQIHYWSDEPAITVDRTYWMDISLGRFRTRSITLPIDIGLEYRDHIKSPTRIYEKDRNGNAIGRYVHAESDPDHLAHACTYSEIALELAVSKSNAQPIYGPR